jgi:penicillin-binding protein 2
MPTRIVVLALLIALAGVAFLARLFQLQILEGSHHAMAVERSLVVVEPLPAQRGRILDRTGTPMAETKPMYHLAVVLAELELTGRNRREQDLWQLDQRRLDALVGDLTARLRWVNRPKSIRETLLEELLAHPGTAVRLGPRADGTPLALVAVRRELLAPGSGDEEATRRLVEGDLLYEDPLDALAREVETRWGVAAQIVSEAAFQEACAELDRELDLGGDRSATVLAPFAEACRIDYPLGGGRRAADEVRLIIRERRDQAEVTLARVTGHEVEVVRERLDRALSRGRRAPPPSGLYFAAGAEADQVAPLLPIDALLEEVPLPDVVGARERIVIVQGDPPGGEGLLTQVCRRLADSLGVPDATMIQALIETHGERLGPTASGRQHRLYHIVLDPERTARLVAGLSERLTALGRPTGALEIEGRLAEVRRQAERELAGRTRRDPVALVRDVPHAIAVRLCGAGAQPPDSLRRLYETADAPLPGLSVAVDVGRSYPFPGSAPHIIGMLSRTGPEGRLQGSSGLEKRYDDALRGAPGGRMRVRTPDGFVTMRDIDPLPGADLVTEIDLELQSLAEDSIERYVELAGELDPDANLERMQRGRRWGMARGGFCMIDPRTGGILVLASNPTFDLATASEKYAELIADPRQPLIDHAATSEQPPGSSFKILTALCALEYGMMVPGEQVWCQGFMAMHRGQPVLRDHAPAGTYDLAEAIQVSSNVYFAIMGDRVAKRLGPGVLPEYARRVGLGWANALDVDSQRVGRFALPTPDNIRDIRPREPGWYPNDTWRMAIGQNCQASPLNVVPIAAAVANGGHIVRPFLVRPADGPVVTDLKIRAAYLDDVRAGMERVTASLPGATAKRLQLEGEAAGIKVAAKTGTAEWGSRESRASGRTEDHAWLIGYAPADRPTVAFAVFIHSGTFGGKACVPIAKRILERYFAKYGRDGHPPAGTPINGAAAW